MPGLHSFQSERTRQNGLAGSPEAATVDAPAPHLRVVTAESEGSDLAASLEQFEAALGRGDLSLARDALLTIRDDQQAERQRIQQEKNELLQAVEDLQQLLDERCRAHEQELVQQKQQLAQWHETEKQNLSNETDQTLAEIQQSRNTWETERAAQAALLVEERSRLDSAAEELRLAQSELESQRADLAHERTELDSELAARRTEFDEEMQAEQLERFRVIDAAIAQRESEWAERQRQLEHELASQRKLHEKQLTLDRESFLRACSEREADLDAIRADVDQQRKELVEERCRSAEQFSETRRQLEQDRTLLQNGLRQMESQLRWVAGSISLSGGPLPDRAGGKDNSPSAAPIAPPATNAEITPEGADSGWVGVVVPRSGIEEPTVPAPAPEIDRPVSEEEAAEETPIAEEAPAVPAAERRQRIEDYRSQLNSLQASLSELHAASDDSEEMPGSDADSDEELTH